ncbi:hypothetical protein, partial [Mycolicibacterium porcinum]|uniref:hypothetical protein n=1 Tax=Mycolicibacterium porcinum TaxID=39693 RepID=UPI00197C877E
LTELMPAGEIIPVTVGTKGKVALAFRGAAEIIDSCTYDGASLWRPSASTPRQKEAPQDYSRPCTSTHHPNRTDPPTTESPTPQHNPFSTIFTPGYRTAPTPTPVLLDAADYLANTVEQLCLICAHPLWLPITQDRGICEGCWLKYRLAHDPVQLPLFAAAR